MIVPFAAGGVADVQMRILGRRLSERLGQQFIIDNRVGASGNRGTEAVARSEPDGYTFGFANTSTHALAPSLAADLSYDPVKDFDPVALIGSTPFVLAAYSGLPATTVEELVAFARRKPNSLRFASAGPATLAYLAGALLQKSANIELTHIPYRGTGQAVMDLIEGRIELQFGTIPEMRAHIQDGKVRALAVTGKQRNSALPQTPTIAESGIPGYEVSLWQAIVAPAGTPTAIIGRFNKEIRLALKDPEIIDAFNRHGVEIESGSPDVLANMIQTDVLKWRTVIKGAGIERP
jgi:tripartite-type tricarboxylate transporter receptor subunit TctC